MNDKTNVTKVRARFDEHIERLRQCNAHLIEVTREIADIVERHDELFSGSSQFDSDKFMKRTFDLQYGNEETLKNLRATSRHLEALTTTAARRSHARRFRDRISQAGVRQVFKVGCTVEVNVALRDDPQRRKICTNFDFGGLYERRTYHERWLSSLSTWYHDPSKLTNADAAGMLRCDVNDIIEIRHAGRSATCLVKQKRANYRLMQSTTPAQRYFRTLPDGLRAIVCDSSTSRNYVQVEFGDTHERAWMLREELVVVE